MAVNPNTQTSSDVVSSLDIEFVRNFQEEYDRLAQIIGLFDVETMAAGTALYQYAVSGSLNDGDFALTSDSALVTGKTYYTRSGSAGAYVYTKVASPDVTDIATYYELVGASGTHYVEGDFIARSKYTLTKTLIGEVEFVPYAKQTTAQAILKSGFEKSILRTDRKAQQQLRAAIMGDFFALLGNGTSVVDPASGTTWNLQQLLAYTSAKLGDVLETNNEETDEVAFFVNRQNAAAYLGNATITTQDAFGMTYLENFLGVRNVMLTNRVTAGTVFATPIENIHVYGLDFAALGSAGLVYETNDMGLVGVHHEGDYNYGSAETFLVRGAKFVPEVTDFIVKGSMAHLN